VAQDVFARVLEALPKYERREKPFRAWLFVVARNAAIDSLERAGRLELLDPEELRRAYEERATTDEEADTVPIGALSWITDRDLSLFVDRIPVPQQQVLVLRYVVDLTDRQIAAIMGRSASDVRMLHSRAVRFLRSRLEALDRAPKGTPNAKMRRAPRHATVLRSRRWALDP
jgi:RNA polymerase sigma-70 factor (ECF subfamily)